MQDRRLLIMEMKEKRMTYAQIGKLLNISRERAWQIAKSYISPAGRANPVYKSSLLKKRELKIPVTVKTGVDGRNHLRELIRIRDKHTCQICLKVWQSGNRRFDVHHMDESQEGKSGEKGSYKMDRENLDKMITPLSQMPLSA
jgi:hypothetical protein